MGGKYTRIHTGMTQEIDGSWAELQVFVPVDRYCKIEEEEPSPAPTRDHIYLILRVKEACTHMEGPSDKTNTDSEPGKAR